MWMWNWPKMWQVVLFCLFLFSNFSFAQEQLEEQAPSSDPEESSVVEQVTEQDSTPPTLELDAQTRAMAERLLKENLGDSIDLDTVLRMVPPEMIEFVTNNDIQLTPEQEGQLIELAMNNKPAIFTAILTGRIPEELIAQAAVIVPELRDVPEETQQQMFNGSATVARRLVFESIAEVSPEFGYSIGGPASGPVFQATARLFNLRDITIPLGRDITLWNVHAEVQAGYPENGFLLLSGSIEIEGVPVIIDAELLGLTYDIRRRALDFQISRQGISYLFGDQNLRLFFDFNEGFRTEDGFYIDQRLGIEATQTLGPVALREIASMTLQPTRTGNPNVQFCAGVSADFNVVNRDHFQFMLSVSDQLLVNSNPRSFEGSVENLVLFGATLRFK